MQHPIAIAHGDGIGPEIMKATLHVLEKAGAPLEIHTIEVGEKIYSKGVLTGITPQGWETIKHTKALLKAPIMTPQGGGFKSLNVTIRTSLGLYANIRPCITYAPFIPTRHPQMDLVIIRENEEDLYIGMEYRQTADTRIAHKLISQQGCEKIHRYAFEYARHHKRKKITCCTKDNILKLSDGLFHEVFETIAKEYPDIAHEHWIIDIGTAKLADHPERFDCLVLPNLYGDILSDLAAQLSGSIGLVPSANIGDSGAMFEAIHGSAPTHAGKNSANPSALLLASVMMLAYLGETSLAEEIHAAWLYTIEKGIHTQDISNPSTTQIEVGTQEFAEAVAKNLGKRPEQLKIPSYNVSNKITPLLAPHYSHIDRKLVGIDLFICSYDPPPLFLNKILQIETAPFQLHLVSNRGTRIWPNGHPETFCIDQMRCRFMEQKRSAPLKPNQIPLLLQKLIHAGYDIIRTEHLYTFNNLPGYSSAEE